MSTCSLLTNRCRRNMAEILRKTLSNHSIFVFIENDEEFEGTYSYLKFILTVARTFHSCK